MEKRPLLARVFATAVVRGLRLDWES